MLDQTQEKLCAENPTDFSDLKAMIVNCTLKRGDEPSHTDTLLDQVRAIFGKVGVSVDNLRAVNHAIAPGIYPDMTEHGADEDAWPTLWPRVKAADILVLGTPIWLGEKSSVAQMVIEKLYAHSAETNAKGQYVFYGKVGGCIVTGNEDGIKHVAMGTLYAMSHVGYTIPPQADAGWIGEAGPGPSYGDPVSGDGAGELDGGGRAGFDNDFTRRNTTFAAWNMLHMARMLKDAGGLPCYGNSKELWNEGLRFDSPNPEYRR